LLCFPSRELQRPKPIIINDFVAPEAARRPKKFASMAATSMRAAAVVAALLLAAAAAASAREDTNGVYEPCADATVQRGDGFTFGVVFAGRDAFSSGGVQLSPCDGRLKLADARVPVALFRPTIDEISLLTVNASDANALVSLLFFFAAFRISCLIGNFPACLCVCGV
jgi:hypothetical protein